MKPTRHKFSVLKQICDHIPTHLVSKLSQKHNVDKKCRSFSPWSHVVSLVFTQLSHALSLNDVCDTLKNHKEMLHTAREATPPSRNGLSHANRNRNADMAEDLFWQVLNSLQTLSPDFGIGRQYCGFPRRFKRIINVVDSTVIQLVSNCMDWAKHRRRKAAAKCHMCLDLQTFLPNFAVVKSAGTHDSTEAYELCANIKAGETVVFDKAYVDFKHLFQLEERGVFWVSRAKDNMAYEVIETCNKSSDSIKKDQTIKLTVTKTQKHYSKPLRLVTADIEVNGEMKEMTFITNNFDWAGSSICDLYKGRWGVEVFFKQIKQTLQLADFLGHNENAVRWQIWTALLTYILLRYMSFLSSWKGSFSRLFTVIRGVLWSRYNLLELLKRLKCRTAGGIPRTCATPQQA